MDREQYIMDLQRALNNCFTQKQSDDILADYSEFFDVGIAEGKSESELCAEFGSPESVAKELLGNTVSQNKSLIFTQPVCILTALVFILLLLFPLLAQNLPFFPSALLFLLPLLLQAIIYERRKLGIEPPVAQTKLSRILKRVCSGWTFNVIILITSVMLGFYLSYDYLWLRSSLGYFLGYSILLIFLAFIYIIRSVYPIKADSFRGVKIILILSFLLIAGSALAIVLLFNKLFLLINMPSPATEGNQIIEAIGILLAILFTLSVFTGLLLTQYAIHKNASAKWFIFLSTTFLSLVINLISILVQGLSDYSALLHDIFVALRFAVAQNIAALVLFLLYLLVQLIRRKMTERKKCNERADEKGNS